MKVKLQANPRNPRKITKAELTSLDNSLTRFGDLVGVVFNLRTQRMVGGHQRVVTFDEKEEVEVEIVRTLDQPDRTGTLDFGFLLVNGTRYAYREVDWPEKVEKLRASKNHPLNVISIIIPLFGRRHGRTHQEAQRA